MKGGYLGRVNLVGGAAGSSRQGIDKVWLVKGSGSVQTRLERERKFEWCSSRRRGGRDADAGPPTGLAATGLLAVQ